MNVNGVCVTYADTDTMEKLLHCANAALLLSILAVLATAVLAYPMAGYLPMGAQIGAHIATLLFATTLKLSYVVRLVSLHRLGRPLH